MALCSSLSRYKGRHIYNRLQVLSLCTDLELALRYGTGEKKKLFITFKNSY